MRYHLLGMYAGVRATGEGKGHRLTQNGSESRFHLCLNRISVRLRLRAVEIGASI